VIDVQPVTSAGPQPTAPFAPKSALPNQPSAETSPAPKPQTPIRIIEKLSTEESESVRRDPAIVALLKVFKGEIGMITKDAPTAVADNGEDSVINRPAASVEIHIDTDDEEELA